jgi:ubiquinone biosynthesis protein UbiJ
MTASARTRRSNPLLAPLGRALEAVLNRAIDLDPDTRGRLDALDGQAVQVDFGGASRSILPALRLSVARGRLHVGPAGDEVPGLLEVAATPSALLAFALGSGRGTPGRVSIRGDAELARRMQQIARDFAPDVDQAFADVFGDVVGARVAHALRGAFETARTGAGRLLRETGEFLSEEGRDLVPRAELDTFLDDVDAIRERADRLDARVRRMQRIAAAEPT